MGSEIKATITIWKMPSCSSSFSFLWFQWFIVIFTPKHFFLFCLFVVKDVCQEEKKMDDHSANNLKESQPAYRKHLTAFNSIINVLDQQNFTRNIRDRVLLQPHYQYMRKMTTPLFNRTNPADPICSHFLLHGFNRLQKAPVHAGCWSSDGRRLVLGTQLGEFNLWEVQSINNKQ